VKKPHRLGKRHVVGDRMHLRPFCSPLIGDSYFSVVSRDPRKNLSP
jgi:hypothetical protein